MTMIEAPASWASRAGHDVLLVAGVGAGRAHAGDDDEGVGPLGLDRRDLRARANHAVEPRLARQGCEPGDLGGDIAARPDRFEVGGVEAGEDG